MVREYFVSSLGEYYEVLNVIAEEEKDRDAKRSVKKNASVQEGREPRLWFRGIKTRKYDLLPTLYRNNYQGSNKARTYSDMNRREDYRYQHFKARVYHAVATNPELKSEWQEIYQHNLGKTRMMDWTESAKTALAFSVEPFIITKYDKKLEYERMTITPCVWVLNPYRLNEKVYEIVGELQDGYYVKALQDIGLSQFSADMKAEIRGHERIYFSGVKEDVEIAGILGLGILEKYREAMGERLKNCVENFEFNPFHYMALRMYSDALPVEIENTKDILPPLAILQPYHTERIRAQRGVFTVYPNYLMSKNMENLAKHRKIDYRAMNLQPQIQECFAKINIVDPHRMARQLIYSGERDCELYPEIENYVEVMETDKYYF